MSTIYRLRPYDEVTNHHFINRKTWDFLASCDLEVEFCNGIFKETAIICPTDERTLANVYVVSRDDLIAVEIATLNNNYTDSNATPDPAVTAEKTYTKDDIRNAGMRVMEDIDDEDDAIASAVTIAKLISKLN